MLHRRALPPAKLGVTNPQLFVGHYTSRPARSPPLRPWRTLREKITHPIPERPERAEGGTHAKNAKVAKWGEEASGLVLVLAPELRFGG